MSDVTRIVINGRSYDSVEQMPPEVRDEYLSMLELMRSHNAAGKATSLGHTQITSEQSFEYNGRTYKSWEELPQEAKEAFARVQNLNPLQLQESLPGVDTNPIEMKTSRVEILKTLPEYQVFGGAIDDEQHSSQQRSFSPWLLVVILSVIVLVLFLLWWFGIRPSDLR